MKRPFLGFVFGALLGAPLVVGGQGPSSEDPGKKPSVIDETMQRKQKLAHEVLDALVLRDFKSTYKNANSLIFLSKSAEFQVHRTPLYAEYTVDFQGQPANWAKMPTTTIWKARPALLAT
jgi:hypothetical protein